MPLKTAQQIEVEFEDMSIPISVKELSEWVEGISIPNSLRELSEWAREARRDSELEIWLNLLDLESRAGLAKILKAPLIKDRSMARQIIRSWVGRQILDEVSDLIRMDEDKSGEKVFNTLERLLDIQPQVTTLDLLEALPARSIKLDLDAFLDVANRWKIELDRQKQFVLDLGRLPSREKEFSESDQFFENVHNPYSKKQALAIDHREKPLQLEIWQPSQKAAKRSSWIIFMPGWGGTPEHFRWLARNLSEMGWPVILLEHPGSDAKAIQELLEGKRPAPGAEVLPQRLEDLYAVIRARNKGDIDVPGSKLVLMGHSLGALTAFLAAGAEPASGLAERCGDALDALSLTNLSQFLQCQIINVLLKPTLGPIEPNAIVAINGFGGLLWPTESSTKISIPVYLTGGTYDLITPALSEQLSLHLALEPNSLNRTLLIEGASHFSPIRVEGQVSNAAGEDLFQLGESFVGFQPLKVQNLLAQEIIRYLDAFEGGKSLDVFIGRNKNDLYFHLLDRSNVDFLLNN